MRGWTFWIPSQTSDKQSAKAVHMYVTYEPAPFGYDSVYKALQRTATGTNRAWMESPPTRGNWQLAHTPHTRTIPRPLPKA